MHNQRAQAQQAQQAEMNKAQQQMLQVEKGKLVEALPEWGDPEKQKELSANLQSYAKEQGFTADELNSLIDHRSVLVLLKAQQYDQLQNSDVKSKKLKNKPKVVRSGTGTTSKGTSKSKRAAKMKRLQSTGHVDDAVSILEDMMNV
jgi:2,3-bisphosphoglycerate-independent phosphoglycerate mutase